MHDIVVVVVLVVERQQHTYIRTYMYHICICMYKYGHVYNKRKYYSFLSPSLPSLPTLPTLRSPTSPNRCSSLYPSTIKQANKKNSQVPTYLSRSVNKKSSIKRTKKRKKEERKKKSEENRKVDLFIFFFSFSYSIKRVPTGNDGSTNG